MNHQKALRAQNSAATFDVALEPKLEIVLNIRGATAKNKAQIRAPTKALNKSAVRKPSLKARKPGIIIDSKKIIISCKDRSIEILELQRSGKKIQLKENFILGFKFDEQI